MHGSRSISLPPKFHLFRTADISIFILLPLPSGYKMLWITSPTVDAEEEILNLQHWIQLYTFTTHKFSHRSRRRDKCSFPFMHSVIVIVMCPKRCHLLYSRRQKCCRLACLKRPVICRDSRMLSVKVMHVSADRWKKHCEVCGCERRIMGRGGFNHLLELRHVHASTSKHSQGYVWGRWADRTFAADCTPPPSTHGNDYIWLLSPFPGPIKKKTTAEGRMSGDGRLQSTPWHPFWYFFTYRVHDIFCLCVPQLTLHAPPEYLRGKLFVYI